MPLPQQNSFLIYIIYLVWALDPIDIADVADKADIVLNYYRIVVPLAVCVNRARKNSL